MSDPVTPAAPPAKTEGEARALELFNEMWASNTEAGKALRARAKEKFPETRLPEEVAEPLVAPLREENNALKARLDAIEAERDEEKKANADRAMETDIQSRLANAVAKFHLTESGIDMAVARMKETNAYDVEAAAAWVAQQTPPPTAPGPYLGPQNINLFGSAEKDERFELLHADPMGRFLDAEFREFATDPDKYVRDAGFA